MQIPAAVGKARRDGLVEEIGRVRSVIPERKGSRVPVLQRTDLLVPGFQAEFPVDHSSGQVHPGDSLVDQVRLLRDALEGEGYVTGLEEVTTVLLLLASRNWLVLAGPSGTGKSRIVAVLAKVLGGELHDIQVKPNWLTSEDTLGYYSENLRELVAGPLHNAVRRAERNPSVLHFVRLDELNLASPEYYLAEVLSATENWECDSAGRAWSDAIQMPPLPAGVDEGPLRVPDELFLIGTVNVDETTQPLSPKVLDRAAVFEIRSIDLYARPNVGETSTSSGNLGGIIGLLRSRVHGLPPEADEEVFVAVADALEPINEYAPKLGGPIAFRQRDGIVALVYLARTHGLDALLSVEDLIDIGISAFVLPKWRGSNAGEVRALAMAAKYLVLGELGGEAQPADQLRPAVKSARYSRSAERVVEMLEQAEETGYFTAWR